MPFLSRYCLCHFAIFCKEKVPFFILCFLLWSWCLLLSAHFLTIPIVSPWFKSSQILEEILKLPLLCFLMFQLLMFYHFYPSCFTFILYNIIFSWYFGLITFSISVLKQLQDFVFFLKVIKSYLKKIIFNWQISKELIELFPWPPYCLIRSSGTAWSINIFTDQVL